MFKQYQFRNYRLKLVILVYLLTTIGILVIGSAEKSFQSQQILGLVLGSAAMLVLSLTDYNILMQLTMKLTGDYSELEKMYRLMCFNVFAHNRDDHSKNFSFLYKQGRWQLSPAYDLTYSNSIGGEHATTVNGNGRNPGMKEILEVANRIKMEEGKARRIAKEICEIVAEELGINE